MISKKGLSDYMNKKQFQRSNKINLKIEVVKTKKESYYYKKQKYLLLILQVTVLLLLVALMIEFDVFGLSYHKQFMTNVFFELSSCGVVVSTIFFIPLHTRKKQYIYNLKKWAYKVFVDYDKMYTQFKSKPEEIKKDIELLNHSGKFLVKDSMPINNDKSVVLFSQMLDDIIMDVKKFREILDESPFYSENINELSKVIEKSVLPAVELIDKLAECVSEQLEKTKQPEFLSSHYIELLCKCNNKMIDIVDKHYSYDDILFAFRSVIEEGGMFGYHKDNYIVSNETIITSFEKIMQDVMIQNAKIELSKSIILEIDKLTQRIENN